MVEAVYRAPQISAEEYKKHRGKHVAIYKNRMIADGTNSAEALKKH